ncbi:cGMP-inhibited 3',5'-cyclic phosphodiesterase 3A-like isoform X2 [Lineus longissimus]|uniref:cGMP-inhibited 3',5'-cyclic phosphodiesterase 3A-like isoform X2 n=1 Tax=Lineus longissimus TaxID=88925 RepID=UPI002B4CE429
MAMHGRSSSRGSRNEGEKDTETQENNGYVQIFVKPLEQRKYSMVLSWIGLSSTKMSAQQCWVMYGCSALLFSLLLYHLIQCDLGFVFEKFCGLTMPICSILCGYYWIALYLRKTWSTTSVYFLFCSCFVGEFIGQCFFSGLEEDYISQPLVVFSVLASVSVASVFSSLETTQSSIVIIFVSFTRFLACVTLTDLPQVLRPLAVYFSGIGGVIAAKYMETVFKPPINNFMTQDGKIPVIKRRRSSSSSAHGFSSTRPGRRTSLPALIQKSQCSTTSYESAIISEAHGLINDMLADPNLPPHVVSGLRAISNLLKPQENHMPHNKPKISPLVSLAESSNYGSDTEDLPYTGERPSSLPKRLRRSLPPSLLRRMSTSTWTTTTSATGMPTLEPEPCRQRSASVRLSRDAQPGTSPVTSRSNSPSPNSPTTVCLTIPKSRSFSIATAGTLAPPPKRSTRERNKSLFAPGQGPAAEPITTASPSQHDTKPVSPLVAGDSQQQEETLTLKDQDSVQGSSVKQRLTVTSDYESSDSPSDHSDNITNTEEGGSHRKEVPGTEIKPDEAPRPQVTFKEERKVIEEACSVPVIRHDHDSNFKNSVGTLGALSVDLSNIDKYEHLYISKLNQWDYPIFDFSNDAQDTCLSKLAYKLFSEVGFFDTFRIPLPEFLNYFHALELGYREKPYHNRLHATDVLHGVYYLTTQAIPGFQQVNPEGDGFNKQGSSSESDSETERPNLNHRRSFIAEDTYGIMGGNFPPLELMALYTAAAMHDYDHPGRTNAFLVATHASQAVLYNDRSVLENHHAAAAWHLLLSDKRFNFLQHLEKAEFKRFRFLVIESILATDLKRHFEILAEFNAKTNDNDAPGVDWTVESDRILVSQVVIKLADINGPAKSKDLHVSWTYRITEEFYEQGDEEAKLGMPISPYMDRKNPQLAKLQMSFINHLVAPLVNACSSAGLLPGQWIEDDGTDNDVHSGSDGNNTDNTEDEETGSDTNSVPENNHLTLPKPRKKLKKIACTLTKNLKDNLDMWTQTVKEESQEEAAKEEMQASLDASRQSEMETIKEESKEDESAPNSPNTQATEAKTDNESEPSTQKNTNS